MKLSKGAFFVLVLALSAAAFGFRSSETLKDIAPYPGDPSKILVASEHELYLQGENKEGEKIFSSPDRSSPLRRLITHPRLADQAFLLAEEGSLEIDLKKGRPRWIFRDLNPPGNRIHSLAFHPKDPKKIYVATDRGLFRSPDGGRTWRRPFRWPGNQPLEFVALLPSETPMLFLGTNREVFFSKNDGESFESGFSLPLSSLEEKEDLEDEEEKGLDFIRFTSLAFSPRDPLRLWVGTREGVFESKDNGVEWERLPQHGLEDPEVTDLVYSEKTHQLIAATPRGIFRFDPETKRWGKLSVGLNGPPQAVALRPAPGESETLLIVSGSEVLEWTLEPIEIKPRLSPFTPPPARMGLFRELVALEPDIREVQNRAIRYGQLGNGRIKRWHWASRLRAFIPSVSFGKDFSLNNNVDIDRGGTNDPDKFILGPGENNRGWDFDLGWELGDFLYSSAQTSIDSRAKLLVELRESILGQVTRVYFERRRLQTEVLFSDPKPTLQEYLDLLLRLDELTAQLDALTGGFLSREVLKIYQARPELKELWNYEAE